MKTWRKPAINIYDVKMDENIASSGAAEDVTDWIWYINGNSKPHKGGRYTWERVYPEYGNYGEPECIWICSGAEIC